MNSEPVFGLPSLLRLLSSHPDGQHLTTALNDGILASFDARATVMWLVEDRQSLGMVGYVGFSDADLARWHRIPLTFDSQMVDVVRHGEIYVTASSDFPKKYPNATFDRDRYQLMMDRLSMNEGDLVGIPIVHQGITHGVVQFTTETPRDWDAHDFSVLTAISSALGLWATHPHTPVAPLYRSAGIEPMLMFTQRQQDIVELVNHGVGNHQIATELHVSVSTVKQELQKIMRSTSTNDRLTAAQRAVDMGLLTAAEN